MTQGRMSTQTICRDTVFKVNQRLKELVAIKRDLLNHLDQAIGHSNTADREQEKDLNQTCLNKLYLFYFANIKPDCTVSDLKDFYALGSEVNELISDTQRSFLAAFIILEQHNLLAKGTPFKRFFEDCFISYEQDHPELKTQSESKSTFESLDKALKANHFPTTNETRVITVAHLVKRIIPILQEKKELLLIPILDEKRFLSKAELEKLVQQPPRSRKKMISTKWQIYNEYFKNLDPNKELSVLQKNFLRAFECSGHLKMTSFFNEIYTEAENRIRQREVEFKQIQEKNVHKVLKIKSPSHTFQTFKPATPRSLGDLKLNLQNVDAKYEPEEIKSDAYQQAVDEIARVIIPGMDIVDTFKRTLALPENKMAILPKKTQEEILTLYKSNSFIPESVDIILQAFLKSEEETLGGFFKMLYKDATEQCNKARSMNTPKF